MKPGISRRQAVKTAGWLTAAAPIIASGRVFAATEGQRNEPALSQLDERSAAYAATQGIDLNVAFGSWLRRVFAQPGSQAGVPIASRGCLAHGRSTSESGPGVAGRNCLLRATTGLSRCKKRR